MIMGTGIPLWRCLAQSQADSQTQAERRIIYLSPCPILRPSPCCLQIIVSCTKGILNDSLETTNQILQRVLPQAFHSRLAYLSGPSFAAEVAGSQPSAVTIAAEDADVAHKVQKLLSTPRFRCYTTQDVAGELCMPVAHSILYPLFAWCIGGFSFLQAFLLMGKPDSGPDPDFPRCAWAKAEGAGRSRAAQAPGGEVHDLFHGFHCLVCGRSAASFG